MIKVSQRRREPAGSSPGAPNGVVLMLSRAHNQLVAAAPIGALTSMDTQSSLKPTNQLASSSDIGRIKATGSLKLDRQQHHHSSSLRFHQRHRRNHHRSDPHLHKHQHQHRINQQQQQQQQRAIEGSEALTDLQCDNDQSLASTEKINRMNAALGADEKHLPSASCKASNVPSGSMNEFKVDRSSGSRAGSASDIFLTERAGGENQKRRLEQQSQNKTHNHLPSATSLAAQAELEATSATIGNALQATRRTRANIERCKMDASGRRQRPCWSPLQRIYRKSSFRASYLSATSPAQAPSSSSPSSSSSTPFFLALAYHIVIISLILHKLPSSNQALALNPQHNQVYSHSQNGDLSIPAAPADNELGAIDAPEHLMHSSRIGSSLDADRQLRGGHTGTGGQRHRRHLVSAGGEFAPRPAHAKRDQAPNHGTLDCQKLAIFWTFLQNSYPVLSSHLFQWATQADGRQSDEQFLWAKSTTSARSIGHLLTDAEHLMAAASHNSGAPLGEYSFGSRGKTSDANRLASWLHSNPAYAKLIEQLRASKNQRPSAGRPKSGAAQPTTTSAPTTTLSPPSTSSVSLSPTLASDEQADELDKMRDGDGAAGGEQMAVLPSQQRHYGRLIQYPHEIGDTDNSNGMARTLDKLRLLNQHARQHQANEVELSDIENNRIPQPQQTRDSEQDGGHAKSAESARNNFVYGEVLLRPQQGHRLHSERQERPNTLGTLRELASEQQRQLKGASSGGLVASARAHNPADVSPSTSSSASNNYGRIITSPPNSASGNHLRGTNYNEVNGDSRYQQHQSHVTAHQQQQQQQQHRQRELGTGGAPNQMIDFAGPTYSSSLGAASESWDELAKQQQFEQSAISGDQGEDEEFDGVFHSGPLREIEVRQLRSLDHHQPQQQQQQKKQKQPDVELVPAGKQSIG